MKGFFQIVTLATLLLSTVLAMSACGVQKGYEALGVKDYFKAKKLLSKGMKYNPEASSYGLSIIYSRNDNPFFSSDSAYQYIVIADTSWANAKERKKENWQELGWTRSGIDSMLQVVSTQFFHAAKQVHTVEGYTNFMTNHLWSVHFEQALATRDSLAFFGAVNENTSSAYKEFVETYPSSVYAEMAQDNFHNSEFYEQTEGGDVNTYLKFIEDFPGSPMRSEAENAVFNLVIKSNTLQAYELFVLGYETNYNIDRGWHEYYQLYLADFSKERMISFKEKYPMATNMEEVEADIRWCDSLLLPVTLVRDSLTYGAFMNVDGVPVIAPEYDFVGPFVHGLAIVVKNDLYGFINKRGELQIPCVYESASEFSEGRAVVEKDGLFGLIDRNNKLLLPFMYDDVGYVSEGLTYVSKGEKYGYADLNGTLVIPEKFDEAFDFNRDVAKVEVDGAFGMISRNGEYVIPAKFEELTPLTDSLILCAVDGRMGVLTYNGTVVIQPQYNQIGAFRDNLALIAKSDTVEYIDITGEVVISKGYKTYPNFLKKGEFNYGTAIVFKKGKYGKINTYGNVVTDIKYDNIGIGKTFIPFEKGGYWGLMSTSNRLLVSAMYESLDLVDEKYLIARENDSLGVLDIEGNNLIPFTFIAVEYLKNGIFKVYDGEHYGLYNGKELIAPVDYERIEPFDTDFVSLVKGSSAVYYDLKSGRTIEWKDE